MYSNVAIVHHTYTITSLVEEELLSYLLAKSKKIIYVTHPFKDARDNFSLKSNVKIYNNGKLKTEKESIPGAGPEFLFFIKDVLFNLIYFLRSEKVNIYFGVDNLNAFTGIILKKLGKTEKVIYYVIDYVPYRFNNSILNKIYNYIDIFCVKYSDQTWNLSDQMAIARRESGLGEEYLKKQITVPVGCHPAKVKNIKKENSIVYLGILSKDQGINLLVESLPQILKRIPRIKLKVIGSGEELNFLIERARKLKVERNIEFLGFVKSNQEVDRILSESQIGVAPYLITKKSFKYFTDPGKIKTYLGAGLPVVMTNISHIANIVKERKAGIVTSDNASGLSSSIIKLLSDRKLLVEIRSNSVKLSKEYSWNNIFENAFKKIDTI